MTCRHLGGFRTCSLCEKTYGGGFVVSTDDTTATFCKGCLETLSRLSKKAIAKSEKDTDTYSL